MPFIVKIRAAAMLFCALAFAASPLALAAEDGAASSAVENKVEELEEQFHRQELLALRRVEGVESRMETLDRNLNRIFLIFGLSAVLVVALVVGHQRARNRLNAERIDRAVRETEALNADIRRELSRPEMEFLRIGHFLRRLMRQFSESGPSNSDITEIRAIARNPNVPASLHYTAQVLAAEYEMRWRDAEEFLEQLRQLDRGDPFVLLHLSNVHTRIAEQAGDVRDRKRHLRTANQYYAQFAIAAKIATAAADNIPDRPRPGAAITSPPELDSPSAPPAIDSKPPAPAPTATPISESKHSKKPAAQVQTPPPAAKPGFKKPAEDVHSIIAAVPVEEPRAPIIATVSAAPESEIVASQTTKKSAAPSVADSNSPMKSAPQPAAPTKPSPEKLFAAAKNADAKSDLDSKMESEQESESQSQSRQSRQPRAQFNQESESAATADTKSVRKSDSESKPRLESVRESDSQTEARLESAREFNSESKPEVESAQESVLESESKTESESATVLESKAEVEAQPVLEAKVESESESAAVLESKAESESEPAVATVLKTKVESESKPKLDSKPRAAPSFAELIRSRFNKRAQPAPQKTESESQPPMTTAPPNANADANPHPNSVANSHGNGSANSNANPGGNSVAADSVASFNSAAKSAADSAPQSQIVNPQSQPPQTDSATAASAAESESAAPETATAANAKTRYEIIAAAENKRAVNGNGASVKFGGELRNAMSSSLRKIGGAIKSGSESALRDARIIVAKIGGGADDVDLPFLPVPEISETPDDVGGDEAAMWKCIRRGDLRMSQAASSAGLRRRNRLIDQALIFYAQAQSHKTNETLYLNWGMSLLGKALHLPIRKREPFFNAAIDKFLAGNVIAPHRFDFSLATLYAIIGRETECQRWLSAARDSGTLDSEFLRHAPDFDGVRRRPWFAEFMRD